MVFTTDEAYEAGLNEYIELVARQRVRPEDVHVRALGAALAAFEASCTRYRIVCTKSHYAGQGCDWTAGTSYGEYYTRRTAEIDLHAIDQGWSAGCWELITVPQQ
jgi:hypothetical protein